MSALAFTSVPAPVLPSSVPDARPAKAWPLDTISDELQWGLREAHNGYLEVLLSTGVVGLVSAVTAVLLGLAAAASASVRLKDPAYSLPLGMLVFGVTSSLMESGMVAVMLPPLVLACCLLKMALFADRPLGGVL